MSPTTPFEEDPPRDAAAEPGAQLVLDLDGFEGPIDVLLQLCREQKVDVTRIAILDLAEQYLSFVREARRLHLELAADYLVMAAWLAFLKSRLLLPEPEGEETEPSGSEMAAALRFQLQRLQAMQEAGQALLRRPRRGIDVFARGAPEPVPVETTTRYDCSLHELLRAYARHHARVAATSLRVEAPEDLYSVEAAIGRLRRQLGKVPDWHTLASFLPGDAGTGLRRRSAFAATFAAGLELCREGRAELHQDTTFGPIFLRARAPADVRGERGGDEDADQGGDE